MPTSVWFSNTPTLEVPPRGAAQNIPGPARAIAARAKIFVLFMMFSPAPWALGRSIARARPRGISHQKLGRAEEIVNSLRGATVILVASGGIAHAPPCQHFCRLRFQCSFRRRDTGQSSPATRALVRKRGQCLVRQTTLARRQQ